MIYINLSSFDVVHPAKGLGKPPKASDVFRKLRRWERVPRDKYKVRDELRFENLDI